MSKHNDLNGTTEARLDDLANALDAEPRNRMRLMDRLATIIEENDTPISAAKDIINRIREKDLIE